MTSRSRSHLATKACTIKRTGPADPQTGQTPLPAVHLPDILCTPLMSLDEGTMTSNRQSEMSGMLIARKQVMIFENYDIQKGDIHVMDGIERPIIDANSWSVDEPFLVLVLNDVQGKSEPEGIFVR